MKAKQFFNEYQNQVSSQAGISGKKEKQNSEWASFKIFYFNSQIMQLVIASAFFIAG